MKKSLFALLMIVALFSDSPSAFAVDEGLGNSPFGNPSGAETVGGQCNWQPMKDSLQKTESAGSGSYTAVGPNTKYGKPLGKYQFIPPTQESMLNKNPQCNGQNCHGGNIVNEECWPVQECLMDALLAENLDRARKDPDCQALIGKPVHGDGNWGACSTNATWSGIAAAMHLGGADACAGVLANGVGDTDGHTSEAYYMCLHSNVQVPGECTPAPYDPNVSAPTLTWPQIEYLEHTGDEGFINTGSTIEQTWIASMMLMAEQFSVNMEKQLEGIGMLFDAKDQAETQRLIEQKVARAHKDYHPSEQMCTFGTFARDLASTERRADLTSVATAKEILQRELGAGDSKGKNATTDSLSRIKMFRDKFCNPADNGNGLTLLCPKAAEPDMQNRDINYTETIDAPLSLDVDLTDDKTTKDEATIFSLVDYLFMHDPIPRVPASALEQQKYQYHYRNIRSIVAMRGIARNSFANIIALKSASPDHEVKSGPYFKALIKEMGLPDDEVNKLLGENPSYYAQMEFLTKTIYQNPVFYTNLYDKPVNVKRIRAAMNAIKLMNDRDIHDAMLRREMLLSMILELKLRERAEGVYNATERVLFKEN